MSNIEHNGFLAGLSNNALEALRPHLDTVQFPPSEQIWAEGDAVDWVYFPVDSLISLISRTADGQSVETSMLGQESAAGLMEALSSGVHMQDGFVQVDGPALRAPASVCRHLAETVTDFARRSWRLMEYHCIEARQSCLCHAVHPAEARLARWLMEASTRSGRRNPMPLTQEFLAAMLGVQRTTVNAFAALLQQKGLIRYSRGKLHIIDPEGLERRACECRRVVVAARRTAGLESGGAETLD